MTRRALSESTRRASRGGTQRRLFNLSFYFPRDYNTRTEDRSQDSRWLHIFSHLCLSMLLYRALTYLYLGTPLAHSSLAHIPLFCAHSRRCYASTCAESTYTSHPLLMLLHLQPYQMCHRVTDWKSDSGAKEPYMASRMHSSHCLPWRLRLWKM